MFCNEDSPSADSLGHALHRVNYHQLERFRQGGKTLPFESLKKWTTTLVQDD